LFEVGEFKQFWKPSEVKTPRLGLYLSNDKKEKCLWNTSEK
jgi:hypothetical protein